MEAKKHEKLRLEKLSGLFFVSGLCLVLALTYVALEWRSFEATSRFNLALNPPDVLPPEEVPFIKPPEPPKPKPIISPPLIEIIDDTQDQEDTPFDIPEPDADLEIPTVDDIETMEDSFDEPIHFIAVEDKPIFPGCEGATDRYACFQEKVQQHIRKNFNYPEAAIETNQQGKVYVQLTIQKDGNIGGIRLRGPSKLLEQEAQRIIKKLPKMTPGKQRGTPVKVPFSVPINFVLQ